MSKVTVSGSALNIIFGIGVSMGVHKGDLNVIRSYVYGDDIHTTIYLSELDKSFGSQHSEIWVMTSGKVKEELESMGLKGQFQDLDGSRLSDQKHISIFHQHGAHRLLLQ